MSTDHDLCHQASQMESSNKGQSIMSMNLDSQQLSSTNKQTPQVTLLPRFRPTVPVNVGSQQMSSTGKNLARTQFQTPPPVNHGQYQLISASNQWLQLQSQPRAQTPVCAYLGSQPLSSTNTRPSGMDPLNFNPSMFVNLGPQPLNKRPILMEASPKFQTAMSISPGFQQLLPLKRPLQMETLPKARTEPFESVRSKLRESLAASLATVTQQPNKSEMVEKGGSSEPVSVAGQSEEAIQSGKLISAATCRTSPGTWTTNEHVQNHNGGQNLSSNIASNENRSDETKLLKCDMKEAQLKHDLVEDEVSLNNNTIVNDELLQGHGLCWASDLDTDSVGEVMSHDLKRPKLEQDGVTSDINEATLQNPEALAVKIDTEIPKVENEDVTRDSKEMTLQKPQYLAVKIEAELFRLHGGVNKKYKEKARSLLFNLKDRSNPELRERVLSGEIAPERLCSMTAEELASEELSQWRLAKAEELAQMVMLPDSEVDIRRLVKKTHKGEFQVEVERDDIVSVEVAVGASVLSQVLVKASDAEEQTPSKSSVKERQNSSKQIETGASGGFPMAEKAESKQNPSNNLATLVDEKADLMQELMVDELKDSALLPPVPSLDEFMQALDIEPPFENLPVDATQDADALKDISTSGENEEVLESENIPASDSSGPKQDTASDSSRSKLDQDSMGSKAGSADIGSENHVEIATDKPGTLDNKDTDGRLKSDVVHLESDVCHTDVASKGETIWEGLVQLNITSLVTVVGFFRSGEKTSTKEWPNFLEIKGRVRVDAFEKFLQELPLSRTRAVMILQFFWKEGSPEKGRLNLCETIDSYIADARVGFAEPTRGVELYFCPPHTRTTEMLGRYFPKEQTEALQSAVNGLIGVVIWRRSQETISPRLSSQSKHNGTKKQLSSRRQNFISNATRSSQPPPSYGLPPRNPELAEETIDDVPPGFGPGSASDEDDLPEFDFVNTTSAPNPSRPSGLGMAHPYATPTSRPVEQMRELVHMYGQSGGPKKSVLEVQPWNDDDDIPEWQPHQDNQPSVVHPPPPPPPPPLPRLPQAPPALAQFHGYQQQPQQPFIVNQHLMPVPPPQQSVPQPQLPTQQLVSLVAPMSLPLQPLLQPQMGQMLGQQNMHAGWQAVTLPPARGPDDVGFSAGGMSQPRHYGGVVPDGQFYGMPAFGAAQNGMGWRPDIPRSRGV